jgi:hypothetical protein
MRILDINKICVSRATDLVGGGGGCSGTEQGAWQADGCPTALVDHPHILSSNLAVNTFKFFTCPLIINILACQTQVLQVINCFVTSTAELHAATN